VYNRHAWHLEDMPVALVKETVQRYLDALVEQQVHFVPPYVTAEEVRIRHAPCSVICIVHHYKEIVGLNITFKIYVNTIVITK